MPKKIITRFAPSPTGNLHIGGLRTALYSYLFARQNNGEFLLRIEDTDRARYQKGSVDSILNALKCVGLKYDNELVFQSERTRIYQEYAKKLVSENKAYYCFCTSERLKKLREDQKKQKQPPKYDGHCRDLSPEKIKELLDDQTPYVIRMKIPKAGEVVFQDLIRGKVSFDCDLIDDQILLKSDGFPTYHLANVIDDHEMEMTHVIRGEDWLPSMPKHILLYEAFDWKIPEFAHLPLILAEDKSKLSKRHGATSVEEFQKLGYLPEALLNFLALLGWNPGDNREIFSLDELIKEFSLEKINKSGAIFDIKKLNWINGEYLRKKSLKEFHQLAIPYYPQNVGTHHGAFSLSRMCQSRVEKLDEIPALIDFIFDDDLDYNPELLIPKKFDKKNTLKKLHIAYDVLKNYKNATIKSEEIKNFFIEFNQKNNIKNGEILWPLRVALSGKQKSPDVFEIIEALGKEKSLERIKKAIKILK